ncbi:MAG TPA: hypothetical protein VE959_36615 [Bryobacteraceae bacterium]|nr:hypothetical protein [Bryobacteraceae bacterium]
MKPLRLGLGALPGCRPKRHGSPFNAAASTLGAQQLDALDIGSRLQFPIQSGERQRPPLRQFQVSRVV